MKLPKGIGIFLLLVLIYGVGVYVRCASYVKRGHSYKELFSIENAQHVRHAKMIADGIPIPRYETHIQHPDGYDTRQDTIVEEYLAGWTYRLLPLKHIPFDTFIHYFVPFLFCIGIFGIYGITKEIAQSQAGGLFAAAFYAVAMASVERSMGTTFIREHLAIPLLTFYLWFTVRAFEYGKWRDYVIAGIVYFVTLSSWRIMNFFTLVLFGFLACVYLFNPNRKDAFKMLATITACIVIGAVVFNTSIRYDQFLVSKQMAIAYIIIVIAGINYWKRLAVWKNIGLFVMLLVGWSFLSPQNELYRHAWETLFFQLRYLGNKPADPSLLSFDARHLWTPPFVSPSLLRFCNEMVVPVALAAYGIFCSLRRIIRKPSASLSLPLLLYLLTILFAYYFLSYRFKTFAIVFLSVFIGYGFVKALHNTHKRRAVTLATILFAGFLFQLYQVATWTDSAWLTFLRSVNIQPREFTKATPRFATKEALRWITSNTLPEEAFVSDVGTALMIAYYANRPTTLHAYFQTNVTQRFREFSYALFSESEQDLLDYCSKYHVAYLFLSGRTLLNDDHDMSFRYRTDNLVLSDTWLVYKLHFAPHLVENFTLVYENPFIRIFQCNTDYARSRLAEVAHGVSLPPIFDETLLKKLSPDDTGKYWNNIVVSSHYAEIAARFLSQGNIAQAERNFLRSVGIIPTFEGYDGLGKVYQQRKEYKRAAHMFEIARRLWH